MFRRWGCVGEEGDWALNRCGDMVAEVVGSGKCSWILHDVFYYHHPPPFIYRPSVHGLLSSPVLIHSLFHFRLMFVIFLLLIL